MRTIALISKHIDDYYESRRSVVIHYEKQKKEAFLNQLKSDAEKICQQCNPYAKSKFGDEEFINLYKEIEASANDLKAKIIKEINRVSNPGQDEKYLKVLYVVHEDVQMTLQYIEKIKKLINQRVRLRQGLNFTEGECISNLTQSFNPLMPAQTNGQMSGVCYGLTRGIAQKNASFSDACIIQDQPQLPKDNTYTGLECLKEKIEQFNFKENFFYEFSILDKTKKNGHSLSIRKYNNEYEVYESNFGKHQFKSKLTQFLKIILLNYLVLGVNYVQFKLEEIDKNNNTDESIPQNTMTTHKKPLNLAVTVHLLLFKLPLGNHTALDNQFFISGILEFIEQMGNEEELKDHFKIVKELFLRLSHASDADKQYYKAIITIYIFDYKREKKLGALLKNNLFDDPSWLGTLKNGLSTFLCAAHDYTAAELYDSVINHIIPGKYLIEDFRNPERAQDLIYALGYSRLYKEIEVNDLLLPYEIVEGTAVQIDKLYRNSARLKMIINSLKNNQMTKDYYKSLTEVNKSIFKQIILNAANPSQAIENFKNNMKRYNDLKETFQSETKFFSKTVLMTTNDENDLWAIYDILCERLENEIDYPKIYNIADALTHDKLVKKLSNSQIEKVFNKIKLWEERLTFLLAENQTSRYSWKSGNPEINSVWHEMIRKLKQQIIRNKLNNPNQELTNVIGNILKTQRKIVGSIGRTASYRMYIEHDTYEMHKYVNALIK